MSESEDILLSKWLQNKLSAEEKLMLEEQYDLESLALILERQKTLEIQTVSSDQLWDQLDSKLSHETKVDKNQSGSRRKLIWVALILLIGASLAFLLLAGSEKTIQSAKGEQVRHLMADGSIILIAPGSSITFNEKDWSNKREIQLEGQAFFDVEKGGSFVVESNQGVVKVLGTEFEIWESGKQMKVQCFEGSVSVGNLTGAEKILGVNDAIDLNNQRFSDVYNHGQLEATFKSGQMKYRAINVASLATELERFYNISVRLEKIDLNKSFTGILVLNDLEKAVEYLSKTMNWEYDLNEQNLIFSSN